ncbi:MAG TPA: transcriptional activator NhaR [Myxococcaceae bacterium]|nr:transcriptional activator NhaR [Myxococcaceae bacterium]
MEWLNYHHLLYFWTVVREGGVLAASKKLRLRQPTVTGQIRALEQALGEKLFERVGRRLELTETGTFVYRYADEIFTLGRELQEGLKGRPTGRPRKLIVGVSDVVPKLIAYRLLEPALKGPEPQQLVCKEDRTEPLLASLALHELDLIITDAPVGPSSNVRAFNHLLGECAVSLFAAPALAARLKRGFPKSLDGAPFLLPPETATIRRALGQWFEEHGVRPQVRGEFQDSALLKVFGQAGAGAFPAPSAIEHEVRSQYGVELVGRIDSIRERFYVITVERKLKHPAAVAISEAARNEVFASR